MCLLIRGLLIAAHPPRGDLAPGGESQLGQDVLDVVLSGAFGDEQPLGDLPVGEALGNQGARGLAGAQGGRLFTRAVELRDECGGSVETFHVQPERTGESADAKGVEGVQGVQGVDQ